MWQSRESCAGSWASDPGLATCLPGRKRKEWVLLSEAPVVTQPVLMCERPCFWWHEGLAGTPRSRPQGQTWALLKVTTAPLLPQEGVRGEPASRHVLSEGNTPVKHRTEPSSQRTRFPSVSRVSLPGSQPQRIWASQKQRRQGLEKQFHQLRER